VSCANRHADADLWRTRVRMNGHPEREWGREGQSGRERETRSSREAGRRGEGRRPQEIAEAASMTPGGDPGKWIRRLPDAGSRGRGARAGAPEARPVLQGLQKDGPGPWGASKISTATQG